jgi:hypothetical protein
MKQSFQLPHDIGRGRLAEEKSYSVSLEDSEG